MVFHQQLQQQNHEHHVIALQYHLRYAAEQQLHQQEQLSRQQQRQFSHLHAEGHNNYHIQELLHLRRCQQSLRHGPTEMVQVEKNNVVCVSLHSSGVAVISFHEGLHHFSAHPSQQHTVLLPANFYHQDILLTCALVSALLLFLTDSCDPHMQQREEQADQESQALRHTHHVSRRKQLQ